jgi:hypothetical protein
MRPTIRGRILNLDVRLFCCEGANVQLTCSSRTSVSHLPETLQIITGPPPDGPREGQYDNLVVDGRRLEPADG